MINVAAFIHEFFAVSFLQFQAVRDILLRFFLKSSYSFVLTNLRSYCHFNGFFLSSSFTSRLISSLISSVVESWSPNVCVIIKNVSHSDRSTWILNILSFDCVDLPLIHAFQYHLLYFAWSLVSTAYGS